MKSVINVRPGWESPHGDEHGEHGEPGDLFVLEPTAAGDQSASLQPVQRSRLKQSIQLTALFLSMFVVALDMNIVATAIPTITAEFHRLDQVGWYGSAFFALLAATVSSWGKAYQVLNMKWTFLTASFIFEIGSLICATAPSSSVLILGRAIQGLGGAGVSTGVYTIVTFVVDLKHVPMVLGATGVVFSIASISGPLVGGAFTQQVTWRWCFYINLPIGGLVGLLSFVFLNLPVEMTEEKLSKRQKITHFDFLGCFTLLGSLICLFLALEWGGISKPWNSSTVIGLFVGFGMLLILFVGIEVRQKEKAMIVPRIIGRRTILVCSIFLFCGFARNYNLPIYFQAVDGVSPVESGVRVMPSILSVSIFIIVSSVLLPRIGWVQPFFICGAIVATIGGGLVYTFSQSTPVSQWIGYQVVAGAGLGMCMQIPVIAAQRTSSKNDLAAATSIVLFSNFLGAAVGISSAQAIFNNRLIASIADSASQIDPVTVLNAGAYNLRGLYTNSTLLETVIDSFEHALQNAWLFSVAMTGIAFLVAFCPEWKSIHSIG